MAVKKVLTIEISDYITRAAVLSYNKKKTKLFKTLSFLNPEGTVDDGFVVDRTIYGPYLKKQLANAKIKVKDIVFVIQSSKIMTKETIVTGLKESDVNSYIEENRDDFFPTDTSEFTFKYRILEKNKGEKNMRIMIYAAHDMLLRSYQSLAREYGFRIQAMDAYGSALCRWQKAKDHEPIKIYLQINDTSSTLTILDGGVLSLRRNTTFGADALATPIIQSGFFGDLDYLDALKKLSEEELIFPSYEEMNNFEQTDENYQLYNLRSTLSGYVRPLIESITRILEFYNTKHRDAVVDKIYVGGPGSRIINLVNLIQSELPGLTFEVLTGLPGIKPANKRVDLSVYGTDYAAHAGAAHESLNFYTGNQRKKIGLFFVFSIIMLAIVIMASGMIVINGKVVYDKAVDELNTAKVKLLAAQVDYSDAAEKEANSIMAELEDLKDFDKDTFRFNEYFTDVLKQLEDYSVQDVLVSSVTSSEAGLTMNVTVNSKEEAAKFIEQLREIKYFDEVQVYSISESTDGDTGMKAVNFSVRCSYKVPEEN